MDRITATVPMRIHYMLVKMLSQSIECHVMSMALHKEVGSLLTEDAETAERRHGLQEKLYCLHSSYKELARF